MDMDTGGAITVGAAITTVGAAVITMAGTGAITTVGGIITAIGGDVLNQWERPHLICVRSLFVVRSWDVASRLSTTASRQPASRGTARLQALAGQRCPHHGGKTPALVGQAFGQGTVEGRPG
jgi:hypothetical protein